ncbi:mitochondrial 54S ribosomal protein rml2 [Tilletia horrida]|uniref:Large ribosomal subunit protein uL2m n=1 Tax=Tilletia horrida TaxID=155126 RepID=A0AAN6JIM3_9BASI|nr:mitochondrial 54S ribosomal protein rml2 [Tilletia horrida]
MLKVRTISVTAAAAVAGAASARAAAGAVVGVSSHAASSLRGSSSSSSSSSSSASSIRCFASSSTASSRAKSSKPSSPRQKSFEASKAKRAKVAVAQSLAPIEKLVSRSLSSVSQVPQTMPEVSDILSAVQKRAQLHDPDAFKVRASRKERRAIIKAQRKDAKVRRKQMSVAARLGVSTKESTPFVRKDRQFKTFKPITASLRWVRTPLNEHLHKGKPEEGLTIAKRSTGGRNHHGHVTVRGRGGGHKRRLRLVDFFRWEAGEQDVLRIEYDPGRSAHIALIQHCETGAKSYILAPEGLRAGDKVQSYRSDHSIGQGGRAPERRAPTASPEAPQTVNPPEVEGDAQAEQAEPVEAATGTPVRQQSALDLGIFRTRAIRPGNVLPLSLIPIGTTIHAISLHPGGPAKICRSAGTSGQLIAFTARKQPAEGEGAATAAGEGSAGAGFGTDKSHAQVKLQSGEVRLVPVRCVAAVGRVSNPDHEHRRLGKAGRSRWLGRRPKVRGVAMNAVDHPHGGGRGKSKSNMHPRSKWGLLKFARTRKPGSRGGNQMVVRPRPRANGKRQGKA